MGQRVCRRTVTSVFMGMYMLKPQNCPAAHNMTTSVTVMGQILKKRLHIVQEIS